MECFETKSVIDKEAFAELKRHLRKPNDRRFLIRYPIFGLAFLLLGIYGITSQSISFILSIFCIFVGVFSIIVVLLLILRGKGAQKEMWEGVKENTGTEEIVYVVSFDEDNVKIHSPRTGGTVYNKYDLIYRFAETKNMYMLFTKANQPIIVNKATLTKEQKTEEFMRFIKDKCKNVRWRK